MPHVFAVMMIIMFLVVVMSWIIPSGNFERTEDAAGNMIVNPDAFHYVDKTNPIGLLDFFQASFDGFVQAAEIIASLFLCAGALKVLEDTGAFSAAIHALIRKNKGNEIAIVILFYTIFSIFGILGYGEQEYPFYPITVSVIMALGYDRLAGGAVMMIASGSGFTSGMINLFTTGVSQEIVGLPLFSGLGFRAVSFVVFYLIGLLCVIRYCKKIKKDPEKSLVYDEYKLQLEGKIKDERIGEAIPLSYKHVVALLLFLIIVIVQGVGCIKFQWGMSEVAGLYVMAVIPLIVLFRLEVSKACQSFIDGAASMLDACLVVGLANGVMVLMEQANILDTIVYFMGNALSGKSTAVTLLLILLFVTGLNFFVSSGSGKAMMMMPIMSPLGKLLGINQQVMVLTYQFGDGFTNNLWPSGVLVGVSLCKLDYGIWFKFAWKVLSLQLISAYILILIANAINLGPF